ncbi:hypothetical protein [Halosimplex salinum]|uniref:hypothetical protein n=1 Tax=Halosimplex salinum TaxID=1710538 RepID=UPI0013DD95C8|nr:hypothetical protein [Halosimplex salinum]
MHKERPWANERAVSSVVVLAAAVVLIFSIVAASVVLSGVDITPSESRTGPETTTQTEHPVSTVVPTTVKTITHTATTTVPTPSPTVSPTATAIPTPTSVPAESPTPTLTATPIGGPNGEFDEFVSVVLGEAGVDAEVPLRLRGSSIVKDDVMFLVVNLTARSENDVRRAKEVNTLVTSGYAQAVAHYDNGNIDGKIPKKLRIAEVNNTGATPKTLHVNTSLTREYYTGQIEPTEFTERYWNTERNQTAKEKRFTRELDKRAGNGTISNEE